MDAPQVVEARFGEAWETGLTSSLAKPVGPSGELRAEVAGVARHGEIEILAGRLLVLCIDAPGIFVISFEIGT